MVNLTFLSKSLRIAELMILFIVLPLLFKLNIIPGHKFIPLIIVFGYTLVIVLTDKNFDRKMLGLNRFNNWRPLLFRFFIVSVLSSLLVYLFEPQAFLFLPRRNVWLWAMIMIFYPLWSVYPQEFIYRAFFFQRYRFITGNNLIFNILNALAFAFLHIIFNNWLAVVLSFGGGLMFAITYARYKSLMLVSVEHALYGDMIFTNGLGKYFYVPDF